MRYAVLIYEKPGAYEALREDERQSVSKEYMAVVDDPRVYGGAQLGPIEATSTVRVQGGDTVVTDGPYADTKEVFGGFYLVEAGDLDAAIEIAARVPAARLGGSVEVRPLATPPQ